MSKAITMMTDTFRHWSNANAPRLGAALSYYAVFSLAPLLTFVIMLVSIIFNRSVVEGSIIAHINSFFGTDLGSFITSVLDGAGGVSEGLIPGAISLGLIIIGAIGVFVELNSALDDLWLIHKKEVSPQPMKKRIVGFLKDRLVIFSIVPISGLLLLLSISMSVFLSFFESSSIPYIGNVSTAGELIVSFALTTTLFAAIFKVLPNTKLPWKEIWLGALITAILFLIGRLLILAYLHTLGDTSVYGSAGVIMAILIWIYYSAQVFLIGASFIFVYSKRYGHLSKHSLER